MSSTTNVDHQLRGLVDEHGIQAVRDALNRILDDDSQEAAQQVGAAHANVPLLANDIMEACFDAMIVTDENGTLQLVNEAARELFGLTTTTVEEKQDPIRLGTTNLTSLVRNPDTADGQQLCNYLRNATPESLAKMNKLLRDVKGRKYDTGTEFPVQVQFRIIPEKNTFVAICHDLSTLGKAKEEMVKEKQQTVEHEQHLNQSILDSSSEAIVVADDDGTIVKVNRSLVTIFGFDHMDDVVGKNLKMLVGGDGNHAEKHAFYMQQFRERGTQSSILRHVVARRRDGSEFPCRIGIRIVPDSHLLVGFIHYITHEKRAERVEQHISKSILNSSFEAIIVANEEDGTIVQINSATLKIFDFERREDVIGQNISLLVGGEEKHAANHTIYMQTFRERGATSTAVGAQRHVIARRRDGSEFPCRIGVCKVPDSNLLVGYVKDITHEKKSEREHHLNESILDSSFESIVVADDEGKIVKVNASTLTTFGFDTSDEIVGQNVRVLVGGNEGHAEHHDMYLKEFRKRGGQSSLLGMKRTLIAKRRDGSEFPCRICVQKVPHSELMVGYIHDITQEKRAEREHNLNESILNSSFESIIVATEEGQIVKVNTSTVETFGFEKSEEIVGQNLCMLVGGEGGHAEKHTSYMKSFQERGGTSTMLGARRELSARRRDGTEFPCRIGVRKVPDSDLLVGFIHDITHEKRSMELAVEKRAAEELLHNMLPREIALRLKNHPGHLADHFHQATILFGDIVGFTRMSNTLTPGEVVQFLNVIFSRFDQRLDMYGLNKVKTIGDCYMVTSIPGCRDPPRSCAAVCHFALDMIQALEDHNKANLEQPLQMRIGINAGPVVAGVVGTKRFLYDVWGDAVNVASRMESTGEPGRVQVTQAVIDAVAEVAANDFLFEKRGFVDVKGIGEMETFFITEGDKNQSTRYWKTLTASIGSDDMRKSSETLELLQNVRQLEIYGEERSPRLKTEQSCALSTLEESIDGE